jgi:hypothetical protein
VTTDAARPEVNRTPEDAYGNADPSTENRTSGSGRLPNDPGPEATGGGVDDMASENLEQQEPGAKLSPGEAEYNKRANVGGTPGVPSAPSSPTDPPAVSGPLNPA